MPTELPIYQVDAFAETAFAGNPAAVMPLHEWLDDETLQAIAMENNLSETAYFTRLSADPDADYHLRWFTPAIEVDLCGHATLASAAVLFGELGFAKDVLRFRSQSGILSVRRDGELLELDFPARVGGPIDPPAGFAEAHGVEAELYLKATKMMAVLKDEAAVRAFEPDFDYIAALPSDGLIVTAPGDECDVASRYFAPHGGIPEDPVTGSAHCTIMPYWAERLDKNALHCRQVSARGGDLYCRMDGDRVRIAGRARMYMTGQIIV